MSADIAIIDTAVQGWRDAVAAREKMPTLFWIALAVLIGLGIVQGLLGNYLGYLAGLIFGLAQAAAVTPLAIAVHRFVLLGEARDSYDFNPGDPRFQRFFLFTVALEILSAIPSIGGLLFLAFAPLLGWLAMLVLSVVVAIVAVRCAILFPSIAVDSPGADWRNALADSKGHSWRIFLVLLCAVLPGSILAVVVIAVFGWSLLPAAIVIALALPVIVVFTVAATAAAASRLYAAYANQLGRPGAIAAPRAA
jgi:hypothetical protein